MQLTTLLSYYLPFSEVQSLSHVRLFSTPWTVARQASLSNESVLRIMWPKCWSFSFSISLRLNPSYV